MPFEYTFETRERAEDLYVRRGYTYEQVAELTEVSIAQLKRWGQEEDWRGKKKKRRQAMADIGDKTLDLRQALIAEAVSTKDPMLAFAVAKMETLALKLGALEDPAPLDDLRQIATAQDAAKALEETLKLKVGRMISQPEVIDLAAINDLFKVWGLLDRIKGSAPGAEAAPGAEPKRGLTDEAVDLFRRELLGLQS